MLIGDAARTGDVVREKRCQQGGPSDAELIDRRGVFTGFDQQRAGLFPQDRCDADGDEYRQ